MEPPFPLWGPTSAVEIRYCQPKSIPSHRGGPHTPWQNDKFETLPTVFRRCRKGRVGSGWVVGEKRSVDTRQGHFRQFNGTRIRGIVYPLRFSLNPVSFALRRNKRLIGEISVTNIKFLRFSHTNSLWVSFYLSKRRRNPNQPNKQETPDRETETRSHLFLLFSSTEGLPERIDRA
ncbi:hypothetical protein AAC387_Pa01g2784 [Persea americana]